MASILSVVLLFGLNFYVHTLYVGTISKPKIENEAEYLKKSLPDNPSYFIPKSQAGINHIFLEGEPFIRGYKFGDLTKDLLAEQERTLKKKVDEILPAPVLNLLVVGFKNWYFGLEKTINQDDLLEMYGVSKSAPSELDAFGDKYSRQVGLHALHEVGQTMVDTDLVSFACTFLGVKRANSWLVGRNFDFEGGRIFDDEKILKWVFPKNGFRYVSVIWSGMVGGVTGVNEHGLFISINAAGSEDSARIGTPTTLLLTEVLEKSKDFADAIKILKNKSAMITDIFTLIDSKNQRAFRIEKSPAKTVAIEEPTSFAVGNHLISDVWKSDKVNLQRMERLTTISRTNRGQAIVESKKWDDLEDSKAYQMMADSLRDKTPFGNSKSFEGHRGAIDALIATHSVFFDSGKNIFFVNTGPSVVGSFIGYDLKESFSKKRPVEVLRLNPDPNVSPTRYFVVKSELARAHSLLSQISAGDCPGTEPRFELEHPKVFRTLADYFSKCAKDFPKAKQFWKLADDSSPEYNHEKTYINERINQ